MKNFRNIVLAVSTILFTTVAFGQDGLRIEAENYSSSHTAISTKEGPRATFIGKFANGGWVQYKDVDFGTGTEEIHFMIGCGNVDQNLLEVHLGDKDGEVIGRLKVNTGRWKLGKQTLKIKKASGKQTITLVSRKGGILVDWFEILDK